MQTLFQPTKGLRGPETDSHALKYITPKELGVVCCSAPFQRLCKERCSAKPVFKRLTCFQNQLISWLLHAPRGGCEVIPKADQALPVPRAVPSVPFALSG